MDLTVFAECANIRPVSSDTLGKEIRRLRMKAEIPLRQFAMRVDTSAAHMSDIEHDRRRPGPDLLPRIAKALEPVGASLGHFERFDTGVDRETQEWIAKTPGARQLLRVARQSGKSPTELMNELEKVLKRRER